MAGALNYFNLYRHNFLRVAVGIPEVRVADAAFNASQTIALMKQAADRNALLAVFPELGVSAYSCEDLFHQQALLDATRNGLRGIVKATNEISVIWVSP